MELIGLKDDVITIIRQDPVLYGEVAFQLGIMPTSLPRLLNSNHRKLRHPNVLKAVSKYTGRPVTDLMFRATPAA